MEGDRGRGRKKGGRGRGQGGRGRGQQSQAGQGGGRGGGGQASARDAQFGADALDLPPLHGDSSQPERGRGNGTKRGSRGDGGSYRGQPRGGSRGYTPADAVRGAQEAVPSPGVQTQVASAQSNNSQESQKPVKSEPSLTTEISKLSLASSSSGKSFRPIRRPDQGGNEGRPIPLVTNHFQVNIKGKVLVYLYEVEFAVLRANGTPANRRLNKEDCHTLFWDAFVQNLPEEFPPSKKLIFDQGKLVLSLEPILSVSDPLAGSEDAISKSLEIRFNGLCNDRNIPDPARYPLFRLIIRRSDVIHIADLQGAYRDNVVERDNLPKQALELLLRQGLYFNDSFFPAGRNFYYASDNHRDYLNLGCGREIRRGFYQSLRTVSNWKITYTLDAKSGVFYSPDNCEEIVKRLNRGRAPPELSPELREALRKEIKGLKLKHLIIGHKFCCADLSRETALSYMFDNNGVQMSVAQYFKDTYNIDLKYKNWPLAMKGRGPSARMFPLEVCRIADRQRVAQKKVTDNVQAAIVKNSVVPPDVRKQRILDTLDDINHRSDERMREFGVTVNMTPIETKGRILEPPKLQYQEKQCVLPNYGSWNMARNRVYKSFLVPINSWGVVCFASHRDCSTDDIRVYCKALASHAKEMGIKLELQGLKDPGFVALGDMNWIGDLELVFKQASSNKLQFLVAIMNGKNAEVYAAVKQFGEQIYGVVTQCVQKDKVKDVVRKPERSGQLLSNVCLKINAKFCGTNVSLYEDPFVNSFLKTPVIFFGADVTHPDPGDKFSPSIAGVAASQDNYPGQYIGRELVQEHRQEWIGNLRQVVREGLLGYYQKCKMKPVRIIFYRDGVSEGQFSQVLQREMVEVQNACLTLESTYNPGITFIIVQKRHNTRLFRKTYDKPPPGKPLSCGRKNIPPGTTVDRDIGHPEQFDFYLASHEGIQGTTKPTHYHVLHDDNGLTSNTLQKLSYYLCHTYARCTRSVSLPPPVYYAHLIAFRARMRLKAVFDSEASRSEGLSAQQLTKLAEDIKVNKNMENTMYWQ